MPMVQIDEGVLRQYQTLLGTVQAISGNSEARRLLQRAQKLAIPASNIPDLDRDTREAELEQRLSHKFDEFLDAQRKRDEEATAARQQAEFQSGWERQKNALREQGYLDDTIDRIEKHAQDQGIPNLRAAAHDFLALNPPPPVADSRIFGNWTAVASGTSTDASDPFMKAMIDSHGMNEAAADAEAWAAIHEFRQATQPVRWGR
jgi:hypothetical protein